MEATRKAKRIGNRTKRPSSEEYFKRKFTPEQHEAIKSAVRYMSDQEVADMMGVGRWIIFRYRTLYLLYLKGRTPENRGVIRMPYNQRMAEMLLSVHNELKALEAYNYQGVMKESVEARISVLREVLNRLPDTDEITNKLENR